MSVPDSPRTLNSLSLIRRLAKQIGSNEVAKLGGVTVASPGAPDGQTSIIIAVSPTRVLRRSEEPALIRFGMD